MPPTPPTSMLTCTSTDACAPPSSVHVKRTRAQRTRHRGKARTFLRGFRAAACTEVPRPPRLAPQLPLLRGATSPTISTQRATTSDLAAERLQGTTDWTPLPQQRSVVVPSRSAAHFFDLDTFQITHWDKEADGRVYSSGSACELDLDTFTFQITHLG